MAKTSQLNLLQLHEEILVEILKFVPRKSSVLQVCRKLKEICENNFHFSLFINNAEIQNEPEKLNQILQSSRKFDKIIFEEISFVKVSQFGALRRLIRQFGSRIDRLEFISCKISQLDLVDFLSFTPNLKKLNLQRTTTPPNGKKWKHPKTLNLHKLQEITLVYSDSLLSQVLSKIPSNTIETFNYATEQNDSAQDLVQNQTSIKNVVIYPDSVQIPDLGHTDLNKLDIFAVSLPSFVEKTSSIIRIQHNLASLDLSQVVITPEMFHCITEMKKLTELRTNVTEIEAQDLKKLSVMNLKQLEIINALTDSTATNDQLKVLSEMKHNSLEHLYLEFPEISEVTLTRLHQNCPNLKELYLTMDRASYNVLETVLRYFNRLETVFVHCNSSESAKFMNVDQIADDTNFINPNLIKFGIVLDEFISLVTLKNLIRLMPNISEFHIDADYSIAWHLEYILKFPRLTNLYLYFTYYDNTKDIDMIVQTIDQQAGNMLEAVTLRMNNPATGYPVTKTRRISVIHHPSFTVDLKARF